MKEMKKIRVGEVLSREVVEALAPHRIPFAEFLGWRQYLEQAIHHKDIILERRCYKHDWWSECAFNVAGGGAMYRTIWQLDETPTTYDLLQFSVVTLTAI